MFAKINNNLSDINDIRNEFVINQTQFDKILKQHNKKFIKFNELSINKDSIEDFDVNKQHRLNMTFIKK